MDPITAISLIAACSSLVKTCGSVVKSLHDILEVYKDAEISILSVIEECENVRFAWTSLEAWANKTLPSMNNSRELLERFQRSIYTGELIMSALENDLKKVTSKNTDFGRHANFTWNAGIVQEHLNRIRGQNSALQLLLQVISLPRKVDRVETMSVNEYIFREVDESVLSIIPSRLSSRLSSRFSLPDSDTSSLNTKRSLDLRYIPFSFENDLFTSYVYKRNFRLPFMDHLSNPVTKKDLARCHTQIPEDELGKDVPASWKPESSCPTWFRGLLLTPREGLDSIYTAQDESMNGPNIKQAKQHLWSLHYSEALSCLRGGVDIICFFVSPLQIGPVVLLGFFWYVWYQDGTFFNTLVDRIAYSAGEAWVGQFQSAFARLRPLDSRSPDPEWSSAKAAGRLFDWSRPWIDDPSFSPSALQLACASRNRKVTDYLLRIGFRADPQSMHKHPMIYAVNDGESDVNDWMDVPPDIFTIALLSLFSSPKDFIYWCAHRTPTRLQLNDAITIFLHKGAEPTSFVKYLGTYMPLIHAVIYALHCSQSLSELKLKMLGRLLEAGADTDALGESCWGKTTMSPLALAMALREGKICGTLLQHNAKVFWWGPEGKDTVVTEIATDQSVIRFLITFGVSPPGFDLMLLKNLRLAVIPKLDDNIHMYPSQRTLELFRKHGTAAKGSPAHEMSAQGNSQVRCTYSEYVCYLAESIKWELKPWLDMELDSRTLSTESRDREMNMLKSLQNNDFQSAYQHAQLGADIAMAFNPSIHVNTSVEFLRYMGAQNSAFLKVSLERIAFSTGKPWIRILELCISTVNSENSNDEPPNALTNEALRQSIWTSVYAAASLTDSSYNKRQYTTPTETDTGALQRASAANNYEVVHYLLRSCHRTNGSESPIVVAALNHSPTMAEVLLKLSNDPKPMATRALGSLLANRVSHIYRKSPVMFIDRNWRPSGDSAVEIVRLLLGSGADLSNAVFLGSKEHPLLHVAIRSTQDKRSEIAELLIDHGANVESTSPLCLSSHHHIGVEVSALALAVLLARHDVVRVLLKRGARNFWCSSEEIFDTVGIHYDRTVDDMMAKTFTELARAKYQLVGQENVDRFARATEEWRKRKDQKEWLLAEGSHEVLRRPYSHSSVDISTPGV